MPLNVADRLGVGTLALHWDLLGRYPPAGCYLRFLYFVVVVIDIRLECVVVVDVAHPDCCQLDRFVGDLTHSPGHPPGWWCGRCPQ